MIELYKRGFSVVEPAQRFKRNEAGLRNDEKPFDPARCLGEAPLPAPAANPIGNDQVPLFRGNTWIAASLIETPQKAALFKNTTVSAVEKFLGSAIGISENEFRPEFPTRDPLEANFRHALILSLQDQNDIDSKQRLFHRQGEDFISQAIKDTLPYFLGAVDEDQLLKQAQLERARKHLRQLERQARDATRC